MVRTIVGYSVIALIGVLALRFVMWILGVALSLLWSVLWLAAIGFGIYLILKVISPETARQVKDTIRGREPTSD
jgi:hypothetical protein